MIDTDTRSSSNAMNEMSRIIRAATENPLLSPAAGEYPNASAVQSAQVEALTVFAFVNLTSSDQTPEKVTFAVNDQNQLVETTWAGTTLVNGHWAFSPTPTYRVLCENVVPGSTLFRYLVDGGNALTTPAGGITDNTQLLSIRFISISLSVKNSTGGTAPVTLSNTIGMPNLGLSRTATGTTTP